MGVSECLDALKAMLIERLPDATIEVGGDEILEHNNRAPRICIVPQREGWAVPLTHGGDGRVSPPRLHTRTCRVLANVWGDEMSDAETLIDVLARALHDLGTSHSCAIVDGAWVGSGNLQAGWMYDLTFTVAVPVTRAPRLTRTLTGLPTTTTVKT